MNRDERIQENTGLVHTCARRFKGRGIDYDDLFKPDVWVLLRRRSGLMKAEGFAFLLMQCR